MEPHDDGGHETVLLASGTVVHRWRSASPPVAAVQLQHGFAEYAERFVHEYHGFVPHLLGRGFEVWAMDLPGHGRSPGRRGLTDTRAAVADHVEARERILAVDLPVLAFGHSYGGLVTAASVARAPRGVAGVALTAPVVRGPSPWWMRRLLVVAAAVAPGLPLPGRPVPPSGNIHDPAVVARAENDAGLVRGGPPLLLGATALEVANELWHGIGDWRTPMTVFHGTADRATEPARSAALVTRIARDDVRFRPVAGGYHELLHDRAGDDRVRDEIVALFDGWVGVR